MRAFLILPLIAMLAGLLGGPAEARVICGRYQALTDLLSERFEERAVASGLPSSGKAYLEIWASEAGTWSVIMVAPQGPTCLIHSGDNFELIKQAPALKQS